MMAPERKASDRKIVLWIAGITLCAIVLFVSFGPSQQANDPNPTTYNTGSNGIKAAYLVLPKLGYEAKRWTLPATSLAGVDAAHTTLILTQPIIPGGDLKPLQDAVADFLKRGGQVLATGKSGALLLPGGAADAPGRIYQGLCYTTPEGGSQLARVGQVSIGVPARWSANGPQYRVAQRCGMDAVVVQFRYGQGEAVWWSSPMPLTNAALSNDASLQLALASIGPPGRTVLFDEYMHEWHGAIGDVLGGLPWWALFWQSLTIDVLLVLSRGRRNGPVRAPVRLTRSSPIEFATSMGKLYERAGATQAATETARTQLMDYLHAHCGFSRELLQSDPAEVAEALRGRFGGDWSHLEQHLVQALQAQEQRPRPKSALALVQALRADQVELYAMSQGNQYVTMSGTK